VSSDLFVRVAVTRGG